MLKLLLVISLFGGSLTTATAQLRRPTVTAPTATTTTTPKPDLLVQRDGTQLDVIVIEIGEREVVYRRSNNPTGPVYRVQKANFSFVQYGATGEIERFVVAPATATSPAPETSLATNRVGQPKLSYSKIAFGRHFYENGAPTTPEHVRSLMVSNPTALTYFQKGNGGNTGYYLLGIPSGILVGAFLGVAIANPNADLTNASPVIAVSVAGLIGSYVLLGSANRNYRRAVEAYNAGNSTAMTPSARLELGYVGNGLIGARLRF